MTRAATLGAAGCGGVAWSMWRDQAERDVTTVQAALGPERYASLCAEGRVDTLEDVHAGWSAERR